MCLGYYSSLSSRAERGDPVNKKALRANARRHIALDCRSRTTTFSTLIVLLRNDSGGVACVFCRNILGRNILVVWGNKKIPRCGIYRWSISRILFRPGPVVSNHPRVASIINLRCVLPRTSSPLPVPWVGRPLGTYLRLLRIEIARFTRCVSIDSSLLL